MNWIVEHYLAQFVLFLLVLARVSGLMMTAPIYGTQDVPFQVRALLSVALAVLVTPLQHLALAAPARTPVDLTLLIGGDLLVGITLGVGISLLFSGVQLAGQVISQMAGLQMSDIYNPGLDENIPVFSQLLFYVALGVFVIIDGHRQVLAALLETFAWLPPGGGAMPGSIADTLTTLAAQSFQLGVQAAAPVMVALLLSTLVLGLISRTLPQLNIMSVGFGFSAMTTLATLALSLGTIAWVFRERVEPALTAMLEAFRG